MIFRSGRYSGFLRPISYAIDFAIIHVLAYQFFDKDFHFLHFIIFVTTAWFILSLKSNFYEIYRFTHVAKIISLLSKQSVIYFLIVFAFFGFYSSLNIDPLLIIEYVVLVMLLISIIKLSIYFLLKKFRKFLGGNKRKVVIVGLNQKTDQLRKFFLDRPEFGYQLSKTFDLNKKNGVEIESCFTYVLENDIDEIYSSVAELNNENLLKLIDFADNNLKALKFLPDNK